MGMTMRRTDLSGLRYLAALLSLGAGVIHAVVTPEHFEEWWGYGLFFLISAAAQIIYALAVLPQVAPLLGLGDNSAAAGNRARSFYIIGIVGNAAIVMLWIITRTLGVPFFGPAAGEVEEVTLISLASVVLELLLIACLVLLVRERRQRTG